jgi:sulfur carrier protein
MNLIRVIPAKGSGQRKGWSLQFPYFSSRLPVAGQTAFFFGANGMEILLNGANESCRPGSIARLVAERGLSPEALIVELNGEIIRQEHWPQLQLREGDRLELLNFVGGG